MKKLRILGAYLLTVLLLLSACGITPSAGGPDAPAENQQQAYGGENIDIPDGSVPPDDSNTLPDASQTDDPGVDTSVDPESSGADAQAPHSELDERLPSYGGYYYDLTNVALYLEVYGELPPNYITKNEARALGWEGGSVEKYKEGAAIGGDFFGNYEALLPTESGQRYTECDIDTDGYPSRGSRRLVFSNDGRYFYTSDHYESFTEYKVTEDYEVIPCE